MDVDAEVAKIETIEHDGKTYVVTEEGYRGKKAVQVAGIIERLQANPGVPMDFEELCKEVDQKYPQDVVASVMALHMTELVDLVRPTGGGSKQLVVWRGPVNPTGASVS